MIVHRRVVQIEALKVVERRANDAFGHGGLETPAELSHVQLIVAQQIALFLRREKIVEPLLFLRCFSM